MSLYEFSPILTPQITGSNALGDNLGLRGQSEPLIHNYPTGMSQLSDIQGGRTDIFGRSIGSTPGYVEEYLMPGFHELDDAMRMYWSGIRVPTKDAYRFMRVNMAGGDKSVSVWNDDLIGGRARLPVAAIDRVSHEFNPEKFSPAYHEMDRRYLTRRGDMLARVFRPVPFLVNYTMTVWAQHRRDAEYILYQTLTRFNPLAEFTMNDGHLIGNVQLRFGGSTDSSEKETGPDQQASIRYEFQMVAEAWLPLPTQVVPTILGRVSVAREQAGPIYYAQRGLGGQPFVPIQE